MSRGVLAGVQVKGVATCVYRELPQTCPVWTSREAGPCGCELAWSRVAPAAGERPACAVYRCAHGHDVHVREIETQIEE